MEKAFVQSKTIKKIICWVGRNVSRWVCFKNNDANQKLFMAIELNVICVGITIQWTNKHIWTNMAWMSMLKKVFDALGYAKVFNTLDLHFNYHHLLLKEGDKVKIALRGLIIMGKIICTNGGSYRLVWITPFWVKAHYRGSLWALSRHVYKIYICKMYCI